MIVCLLVSNCLAMVEIDTPFRSRSFTWAWQSGVSADGRPRGLPTKSSEMPSESFPRNRSHKTASKSGGVHAIYSNNISALREIRCRFTYLCWDEPYIDHIELRIIETHSPQSSSSFNMLGEFDFSDEKLQDTISVLPPKKQTEIIPENWEAPNR